MTKYKKTRKSKSFNKIREHYHVPLLLVLINFFMVAFLYYAEGHSGQRFSSGEILKAGFSGISLIMAFFSLLIHWEPFSKVTYTLSFFTVFYLFIG